jgi:uncharacterized membrane protein YdjX (TVP38/TMEM64 family)
VQSRIRVPWKWLIAAIAGAAVFLGLFGGRLVGLALSIEPWLPDGLAGPVAYAGLYAAAPLLMLPSAPFGWGAGILLGFWPGLAAVTIGSVLANAAGFLLARHYMREEFEGRIRRQPRFAAIDRMVGREGWKIVGLLRLTWLHEGFTNYLCGTTAVRFRPYLLVSAVGLLPGNILAVYLGTAGLVGYEALIAGERDRTTAEFVLWAVGALVALGAIGYVALKAKGAVEQAANDA